MTGASRYPVARARRISTPPHIIADPLFHVGEMLNRRVLVSLFFYLQTFLPWPLPRCHSQVVTASRSSGLGDISYPLASRRSKLLDLHHLRSFRRIWI